MKMRTYYFLVTDIVNTFDPHHTSAPPSICIYVELTALSVCYF